MPGNYTFNEYMALIASAESKDELQLIDGMLQEDRKNKLIDVFQYIDLKSAWVIRLTEISADEAERNMF
jgi:hypothetical protein